MPDPVLLAAVEAATRSAEEPKHPARFAVLLSHDQSPGEAAALIAAELAGYGPVVAPLSPADPRELTVVLPGRMFRDESAAFEAAHQLRARIAAEAAEPDLLTDLFPEQASIGDRFQAESFPPGCWAPEADGLDDRWALRAMRVEEAWAFSDGQGRPSRGRNVVIAQPDTGVAEHPELGSAGRVASRDILDGDGDPTDPMNYGGNPGHGTATGSVAVSPVVGRVWGTAPDARHMPIRAIENVIRVSQVNVAKAIDFAVDNGAHVITMSLGGLPSFSLHRALRRAVAADVLVLAAAGNCVKLVVYPARYDRCIAVAGVDSQDQRWRGSCAGPDVDFSAPGENVCRAGFDKATREPIVGQGQGTSFAVALAAGVAACWLAHHGRANLIKEARLRGETLQEMFKRLVRATARRPEGWPSGRLGTGVLDALALLQADLDKGREREAVRFVDADDAARASIRRLVFEAVGPKPVQADLDWEQHAPELALSLFRGGMDEGGLRPEGTGKAPLSRGLTDELEGTALGAVLGLGLGEG